MPVLELKNIRKSYFLGKDEFPVLKGIDLEFERGDFVSLLGESGGGKSTLMNIIGGLDREYDGDVIIDGVAQKAKKEKDMDAYRRDTIGFIFQSYNLLPSMTAVENVALPLMFRGMEKEKREGIAQVLLRRVGLSHRLHHYPGQMSGGQQQRAGIARAFVTRPQVVFADEPTGNLDSRTTEEIMKMIMGFARKYHETIILVTHDPGMARFADRIVTLKDGNVIGDERMDGYAESI